MSRAGNLAGFASVTQGGADLNAGIVTAISFSGDGSGLTNVSGSNILINTGFGATFTEGITVTGAGVTIHNQGIDVTGIVTATEFRGDGSQLSGVVSGIELQQGGTSVGSAVTAINFSGATITAPNAGLSTVSINQSLTIGVRAGSAVTFNITNSTFNVSGRSGNVVIDV